MTDVPPLTLRRPRPTGALISLVAMIDVLLILLVFFMVTSTYLDLNMMPALAQDDETGTATQQTGTAQPVLVRIGADGRPAIRGKTLALADLDRLLRQRLTAEPTLSVVILPTGQARTQALVSVMDTATQAGAGNIRVIHLESRP
ncbi:biopolymer transporter ExbD [Sulfitobacter sp. F26204]|uniref:ExbD/TolR family protein n=1 Tax=Sulfitobacter sp. F26204 TaxID=2996014 RepID=UPI00225DD76E|nr:biopolymer transporter ExbD [Sulfitobacter sp. F26204]MCX7561215.1 biopolymer transporter ExbD [Sulfitobacter sp. F26204]